MPLTENRYIILIKSECIENQGTNTANTLIFLIYALSLRNDF